MTRSLGRLAVTLLALGFAVPSSMAQKKKGGDQDPMNKPRNEKVELKKAIAERAGHATSDVKVIDVLFSEFVVQF